MDAKISDLERLSAMISVYPPTDKNMLLIWKEESNLPILNRCIDEWIQVIDGNKLEMDETVFNEALEHVGRNKFAEGGTVGDVKQFFTGTDFSLLPQAAQVFISTQIVNHPAIAEFSSDNETFQLVKKMIDDIISSQKVEPTHPVEEEKTDEIVVPDNLKQAIEEEIVATKTALKYADADSKKELTENLKALKTALKYLPEEKNDTGVVEAVFEKGGSVESEIYFDLTEEQRNELESGEQVDYSNHWVLSKVNDEYEATYDGSYMHVFKTYDDLIRKQNDTYYEYNQEISDEIGHETFTDADGKVRKYAKGGRIQKTPKFTLHESIRLIELSKTDKQDAINQLLEYIELYEGEKLSGENTMRFGRSLDSIIEEYKSAIKFIEHNDDSTIKNQYLKKEVEQIWNLWTPAQRKHFLTDHWAKHPYFDSLTKYDSTEWKDIPDVPLKSSLYQSLYTHIHFGQYEKGGRTTRGISRDRKFVSKEEHEENYERKTSGLKYLSKKESGGQVSKGLKYDLGISRDLAIRLLKDNDPILSDIKIFCKEVPSDDATNWAELSNSDLVSDNLPKKYKTFEVKITSANAPETENKLTSY